MNVLGVDPGLSGAVALVGPGVLEVHRDFKHWEDIADACEALGPRADRAVIELVASRPGQGVSSMFNFGRAGGAAIGALRLAGFSLYRADRKPLLEVIPFKWQRYYRGILGLAPDFHFDSREICRVVCPNAARFLEREKDHNSADAVLIALWHQMAPDAQGSERESEKKVLRKRRKAPSNPPS